MQMCFIPEGGQAAAREPHRAVRMLARATTGDHRAEPLDLAIQPSLGTRHPRIGKPGERACDARQPVSARTTLAGALAG
jgi:hypothetical protein